MNSQLKRIFISAMIAISILSCTNSKRDETPILNRQAAKFNIKGKPKVYENMLSSDSLNTEIRLKLIAIYYYSENYEKAIKHSNIVLQTESTNKEAYYFLANSYYDMHQFEKALPYLEKYHNFDINSCNMTCRLANCLSFFNQDERALELLQNNFELNPSYAQTHYFLAVVLKKLGRTKESEKEDEIYNNLTKLN